MTLLIAVYKKYVCSVTFIIAISKVIISKNVTNNITHTYIKRYTIHQRRRKMFLNNKKHSAGKDGVYISGVPLGAR